MRLLLVVLCLLLSTGCSPLAADPSEVTGWHACERNLQALAHAVVRWQAAHHGALPDRLEDVDLQDAPVCAYSGFVYGYWPDHRRGRFQIFCRGWSHRLDLGNVNLEVDSRTPDFASFTSTPVPGDWQGTALRARESGVVGSLWPGHNGLLLFLVCIGTVIAGLREIATA